MAEGIRVTRKMHKQMNDLYRGIGEFAISYENLFEALRVLLISCLRHTGMKNQFVSEHLISGADGHVLIEVTINVLKEIYCNPHELSKLKTTAVQYVQKADLLRSKLLKINECRVKHIHTAWLVAISPSGKEMKFFGVKTGRGKKQHLDFDFSKLEKDTDECRNLGSILIEMRNAIDQRKIPFKHADFSRISAEKIGR